MTASLALYRRYRPETFAEVIGQDHVTTPLRQALARNKVNHAYLFSGPRGCGKTTSARILARALNCQQAPISDPCGSCPSCRDLARGGPGSIDVIEIDAASHGGVDDARELRERAFFSPVNSRYKIYIIDEAHMVSSQGFNALLKLVEEPPEHLKFIFATTEPDKVIPTIRSRTHHYPFRLIPPRLLQDYLSDLCAREGVPIEQTALPLVVRAGAGSARDTLSVLDQLIGGAGEDGVTYEVATNLLGYTPDNLLDDVVDGLAAGDGAAVFEVLDKVMESGQDPRRFTEDLLHRLRDLVIISAVPEAPANGLLDIPADAAQRLTAQSARFGRAELVRTADIVATGLTEMRGATAPRLLLELICSRVLLPASSLDAVGLATRMDRLERRIGVSGIPTESPAESESLSSPTVTPPASVAPATPAPEKALSTPAPPSTEPSLPAPQVQPGVLSVGDVRRIWPDLLEEIKKQRRFAWILLSQNAQVVSLEGDVLTLGIKSVGARDSFFSSQSDQIVSETAQRLVGSAWRVEAVVEGGSIPTSKPPTTPATPLARSAGANEAQAQLETARNAAASLASTEDDADEVADIDDPVINEALESHALLEQTLGATVIDEITHEHH